MGWFDFLFGQKDNEVERLKAEIKRLEADGKHKNELIQYLQHQKAISQPIDTSFTWEKSRIEPIMGGLLREDVKNTFPDLNELKIARRVYKYTSLEEVQRWASFDPTNEIPYRTNEFNCENYALLDMAQFRAEDNFTFSNGAFGFCWGYAFINGTHIYHAWNICYADGKLYFLEPQSDSIFLTTDTNHDYKPDFIYI